VSERLKKFGLNFETDIIGITTDGANVMVKVGRLLPCYQQLCFAHGIQLAVIDVLYKKEVQKEVEHTEIDESDEYDDEDTENNEGLEIVVESQQPAEVIPRYSHLLRKVRNRTRWNSLLNMLERLYSLKVCIDKALIDIDSDTKFSADEWSLINELIASLQPFKLAVEALCRRELSLITADTTLRFVLDKLKCQDTMLSAELSETLRKRIGERRRTEITGLLIYLQNPKKTNMLNRVNTYVVEPAALEENTMEVEYDGVDSLNFTLEQELEIQLKHEKENFTKLKDTRTEKDYNKILKKEMAVYESEGVRGENLSLVYDYPMTLKPTSVEAERAFSAAGYICSSLRSRMGDNTINTICFLRSYFQKNSKK
jgi:hypothetical protein